MTRRQLLNSVSLALVFSVAGAARFAQAAAPVLQSGVSRLSHGATPFDVQLPLTGGSGIECRDVSGGMTIVLTFDKPVTAGAAAITAGAGAVSGAPTFAGNLMTVKLTGVTNSQSEVLTVSNVVSTGGTLASAAIPFRTLLGDVNASASVSASDVNIVSSRVGQAVNGATFRSDINHGGGIDAKDLNAVKQLVNGTVAGGATANTPPTVGTVPDQNASSGISTPAVGVLIGDAESDPATLALVATSDNQTLLPDANITLGGTGASRTVSVKPAAGQVGTCIVTLTVSDGLVTAATTFNVKVVQAPTLYLATLLPQGAALSQGTGSASLLVDADGSGATLRFSYSNLSSPKVSEHIHGPGAPGVSAGILFDIDTAAQTPGVVQPDGSYRWTFVPINNGTIQPSDILGYIQQGLTYLNIHSSNYPSGEIRGQFRLASGSQTFTPPAAPPSLPPGLPTANDAARFLTQASFGPTTQEISKVQASGFQAWIDDQASKPATSMYSTVYQRCTTSYASADALSGDRCVETAWKNMITAPDQLRQRVAFAYSELFVVSLADGNVGGQPAGVSIYWDMLASDAFGNFRQILQDVTLNASMGQYLNMRGNKKPVSPNFQPPNENYAREILQLFSVGLNQLQPDGTLKLDAGGLPIPTYDQTTIQNFAQVFTGWNLDSAHPVSIPTLKAPASTQPTTNPAATQPSIVIVKSYYNNPMLQSDNGAFHSTAQKTLLAYQVNGTPVNNVIPATSSQSVASANAELKVALDNIFNHPNVGPFVARRLIQRLVCSNPSPAYIYRVASVFNNDGTGVRGNMKAVITAILTDYEARSTTFLAAPGYGHLREPVLSLSAVIRAFHPTSTSGYFKLGRTDNSLDQSPLRSPTVFNFFEPDYVDPGPIAGAGLFSPELEIVSQATGVSYVNTIYSGITGSWPGGDVKIDLTTEAALVGNPTAFVAYLNNLLMGGTMDPAVQTRIINFLNGPGAKLDALSKAKAAVYLAASSAQYAAEK